MNKTDTNIIIPEDRQWEFDDWKPRHVYEVAYREGYEAAQAEIVELKHGISVFEEALYFDREVINGLVKALKMYQTWHDTEPKDEPYLQDAWKLAEAAMAKTEEKENE